MKKFKTFDYANNYIGGKIAEQIGIEAKEMAYDEDGTRYYYWYDKDNYEILGKKRREIQSVVNKVEDKDIMIGLLKEDDTYKGYSMLIVGIDNSH